MARSLGVLATLLATSAITAPAAAQVAPVQPPTREEIQRVPTTPSTPPPSRLTVEGGIERAPCPLAAPQFANISVNVTGAEFSGLRGLSPDLLRPAWAPYEGRRVSIATVCEIRDAAASILRREGYLAAVEVPPQEIANGIVRFDVLMAKLVAIRVRGDAGHAEKLIAGTLEKLTGQEAFNEREAERTLLLARDIPGYDVRLILHPAGNAGEVIGEVTVTRVPYVIEANVQNFGSREVGRFGVLVRGEAYDLLGLGDRLSLGFYTTPDFHEQKVVQLGYDLRAGTDGLTIGGRLTYAWSEPAIDSSGSGRITSRTLIATGEISYPFVRSQSANLRGAIGLDVINQKVRFNGLDLSDDKLRVIYGRLDFEAIDRRSIRSTTGFSGAEPRWRVAGSLELRQGIDALGASNGCGPAPYSACFGTNVPLSRVNGDPSSTLLRFGGSAEYRPVPRIAFVLSPRAQYTRQSLLGYEQFSAGNYTFGRGYDPGTLIGDTGVGLQAEIRIGSIVPSSRDDLAFQPYVFYDRGWLWNRHDPVLAGFDDPQHLSSAGGGVRMAWGDKARFDLTLAKPLDRAGPLGRRGDMRVLMSLTTKLQP